MDISSFKKKLKISKKSVAALTKDGLMNVQGGGPGAPPTDPNRVSESGNSTSCEQFCSTCYACTYGCC